MSGEVKSDRSMGLSVRHTYENALWRNVWSQQPHIPNALLGESIKQDTKRHKKPLGFVPMGPAHVPFHMERLEYAKRLKMLSMNPSVYGNLYGVLGTS